MPQAELKVINVPSGLLNSGWEFVFIVTKSAIVLLGLTCIEWMRKRRDAKWKVGCHLTPDYVCVFICSSVRLFVCLFIRSFIRLFVRIFVHLFVCLFVRPSLHGATKQKNVRCLTAKQEAR